MAIGGNNLDLIQDFKTYISSCFKIKDLGPLKYFLGLETHNTPVGFYISQRKYSLDLLIDTGLVGSKPIKSPIDTNSKLTAYQGNILSDPLTYRRLIGRLMYLTITRPDITYSVNTLSRFMQKPTDVHLIAAHRILKYIKGTLGQGLYYSATNNLQVEAFCDSDWASCMDTRRSVTGFCIKIGDSLVSWKSKKQKTVSRSSSEAEYRAMASATSELAWMQNLFHELQIKLKQPMRLFCDNQAAIHIATNPVFHERTKHIELDLHYTREKVEQGMIKLAHLKSEDQPGDLLTKPLSVHRIQHLLHKLNIVSNYAQLAGG
ncbi:uncharacterized mitochondrial protein AtMg00810-like [Tripterygium wilfordii]|uniref:uncharacterized mitochondrial protein AtMg00810-like n=1 Tax=Tripterygium wilfordii TaxID=458696 RepID=UPI0018F82AC9|nr:uncharacterized mitochondrial protein AtMg00810-like [Tripterygium wilfordii]